MTTTTSTETTAKYDAILDLEQEVRITRAIAAFQGAGQPLHRRDQQASNADAAQRRLYLAVDALTDEEAANFLAYRVEATKVD